MPSRDSTRRDAHHTGMPWEAQPIVANTQDRHNLKCTHPEHFPAKPRKDVCTSHFTLCVSARPHHKINLQAARLTSASRASL